jgi:uncharacterized RDD family membrane protein YckC
MSDIPSTNEAFSTSLALPRYRHIGALWRRVCAFLVDGIVVGLAATFVASPFFEPLSRVGPWGPLLGFIMALPYYAILNSKIGDGQTLGKRLLDLQVIGADGNPISFGKSVLRYAVFAVPYYLGDVRFPATRTPWLVATLFPFIATCFTCATVYLIFFNRRTRQGVHDLSAGSYVCDADILDPVYAQPIWRIHWVILAGLMILVSTGGTILGNKIEQWGRFPNLLEDLRLIERWDGVQSASIEGVNWSKWGNGEKKKILVVNIFWAGETANAERFASEVAKQILHHDSTAAHHDLLRVVLQRGYDLGIARAHKSQSFEHTPDEWNQLFFGSAAQERSK